MAAVAEAAEAAEAGAASDLDYMRSKMVGSLDDDDDDDEGDEEDEGGEDEDEDEATGGVAAGRDALPAVEVPAGAPGGRAAAEAEEGEEVETLAEHGRLFVRNLPFDASEEELQAHLAMAHLAMAHPNTSRPTPTPSPTLTFTLHPSPAPTLTFQLTRTPTPTPTPSLTRSTSVRTVPWPHSSYPYPGTLGGIRDSAT